MSFDRLASTYDTDFTHTRTAAYLRAQVHARLEQRFHAGVHVLELGCGTGEDALYLAQRGVYVTATDASESMLATARAKINSYPLITLQSLDLHTLPHIASDSPLLRAASGRGGGGEGQFDGVFSNFGPLNVLSDWRPLAAWLARQIKPGGVAAFGVMSPLCLWEMAWHGAHGDFSTAFRRLRKTATFQADSRSDAIVISYPSIRHLSHDFAPYFRRVHVSGLGLFLPPSDVYGVIEKRPRLFNTLLALEKRCAPLSPLALFADHYWIEFERTNA
ncbi:MAG: class I SAM-dependent methyltransferase [Anaerolineae bacterium]